MTTNQQQLDRLEADSLVALAAVIFAALGAAAYFVTSSLAATLPMVAR